MGKREFGCFSAVVVVVIVVVVIIIIMVVGCSKLSRVVQWLAGWIARHKVRC